MCNNMVSASMSNRSNASTYRRSSARCVSLNCAAGAESLVLKHAASYNPDAVFLKPLDHRQLREWLSDQPVN